MDGKTTNHRLDQVIEEPKECLSSAFSSQSMNLSCEIKRSFGETP